MAEMPFDIVKADLQRLYNSNDANRHARLTEHDIRRWSASVGVSRTELYDRIAMYLAQGFNNGDLSFEFCDLIVNHILGVIAVANEERPDTFWKVFLAFDDGEYYHAPYPERNPVEAYTRPMIARIVSGDQG